MTVTVKMGALDRTFRAPQDPKRNPDGYRPAIGHPRDTAGNVILEYTYAPVASRAPTLF